MRGNNAKFNLLRLKLCVKSSSTYCTGCPRKSCPVYIVVAGYWATFSGTPCRKNFWKQLFTSPVSLLLLPTPGGTIMTWLAADCPGLALLSVLELTLTFWALSLILFRLLLLLALLTRRSMMLNMENRRAMMLKVLISLFARKNLVINYAVNVEIMFFQWSKIYLTLSIWSTVCITSWKPKNWIRFRFYVVILVIGWRSLLIKSIPIQNYNILYNVIML